MTATDIPLIDVGVLRAEPGGAPAAACIEQIDAACTATGFFGVTGHGLDLPPVFDAAHRFFALSRDVKERSAMIGNHGYAGPESRRTDGKEMLDIGLTGFEKWPELPGFRATVERYQSDALGLAADLLRALALALDVGPTFFAERMRHPQCFLRMLRYPAMTAAEAHTDYGAITLLATDGTPGLEVRSVDGGWWPVAAPEGSLIVNLGDMLARWTNRRYVSTPHRVREVAQARCSIPFFVNPDPETVVACIPSCVNVDRLCADEPITAGEFLQGRIDGSISTGDGTHG